MRFLIWSTFSVLSIIFIRTTQAHVGDQRFSIIEVTDDDLSQIDLKDGSVDDWQDIVGDPTLTAQDFVIDERSGSAYDPADLDFRIWLSWHQPTGRIYVAIEAVDDIDINEYSGLEGSLFMVAYDSFVFMVDGDHSGGEYSFFRTDFDTIEEWRQRHQAQAQTYTSIAQAPDARYVNLLRFDEWFSRPPYVDGTGSVIGEAPTVSVIEFYVTPFDRLVWDSPEESRPSKLYPGEVIGFAMQVVDYDTAPQMDNATFLLPPFGRSFFTADLFVDGILASRDGKIPEASVVEQSTWGWIKEWLKKK